MKNRLSMRTALLLGLPEVARNIGRARRWWRALPALAGHEAGQGNVVSALGLMLLYAAGL
ncbi:hypothetical protein MKK68_03800 [Methylobacterium sp. E-016]|uniref:hypothetical protein n=1 Tax=Methylobacterium sp. E-016 TaxID=2836556 RepID=UPI001FBA130B|nr:hypothetical protein [Methylobacterium sp. E-016]MCJ2074776.1 hypothetical protein [Methylobacterium sp. E-016]